VSGTLNETCFVLRDYLDPVAILTTAGVVDERYRYDAFGPVRVMDPNFATRRSSTCAWNWLYHGEFLDAESGMYDYGYRFYHPALGEWASRDSIGERGAVNLYGFVGNASTLKIDFIGLATVVIDIIEDVGTGVVDINPFRDNRIPENDVSDRIYPQIRRQTTKRTEEEVVDIACCSLLQKIRESARLVALCKDSARSDESESNVEITTVLQIIEDQKITEKIEIWQWGRDGDMPSIVTNVSINQDGHINVKTEIPFETDLPLGDEMVITPFVNINNNRRDIEILRGIGITIKF